MTGNFIVETGVIAGVSDKKDYGVEATVALRRKFDGNPQVVVGLTSCSLATGNESGVVSVQSRWIAPDKIWMRAELPEGLVSRREFHSADFSYTVIGSEQTA